MVAGSAPALAPANKDVEQPESRRPPPAPARGRPLVSVIIPAFNAAAFVAETLASAQTQTWPALEIIVVDDGSTDDTAAIIEAAAASDPRITLLRQPNAGVAAARNLGIAAAQGEYIAPLDADDLWHPHNVAAQVEALERAGPATALAYASYVVIDERGVIQQYGAHRTIEARSDARLAFLGHNFIGNGSACVIRRDRVLSVGGYDTSLRARAAQGCEDLALYMALAERWDLAAVPRFLIGYRQHAAGMSLDSARMARSGHLVLEAVAARWSAEFDPAQFAAGVGRRYALQFRHAVRNRDLAAAQEVLHLVRGRGRHCIVPFGWYGARHILVVLQRGLRRVASRQLALPDDWPSIEPLRPAAESAATLAVDPAATVAGDPPPNCSAGAQRTA